MSFRKTKVFDQDWQLLKQRSQDGGRCTCVYPVFFTAVSPPAFMATCHSHEKTYKSTRLQINPLLSRDQI